MKNYVVIESERERLILNWDNVIYISECDGTIKIITRDGRMLSTPGSLSDIKYLEGFSKK